MATDIWKNKNKDKLRKYRREWYSRNKKRAIKKVLERKKELREWLNSLKENLICNRCGESHIACLDFHHKKIGLKEFNIANAPNYGWSKTKILNEIKKCEVLCSNCHRKEHWKEK